MTRLITVATFTGPMEAHIAKGRLEVEGIPAFLAHEHHVWANWAYSHALGGIKLQVVREHVEQAKRILRAHEDGAYEVELRQEVADIEDNRCPRCGSTDFKSTIPFTPLLLVVLTLGIFSIIFPLRRENHRCRSCGCRWRY